MPSSKRGKTQNRYTKYSTAPDGKFMTKQLVIKQGADEEMESFFQQRKAYNKPIKPNAQSQIHHQPKKDPKSGQIIQRTMVGTHDIVQ